MLKINPCGEIYDVLVAGGGPAGCAAAEAAAASGAKTLLLESSGALGGMATNGLVTCFAPFSDGEKLISRGFAERILRRVNESCGSYKKNILDWITLRPEALKRIYEEELLKSGAQIRFFSTVCGAETEDGSLRSVYAAGKDGITEFRAKVFVDGTGDADLAAMAGVPFVLGDGATGEVQPASLCFIIGGIRMEKLDVSILYGGSQNSVVQKIIASDAYPLIRESHLCIDILGPGIIGFNAGHLWNVCATEPASATEAMLLGRQTADQFYCAFKEFLPEAFSDAVLLESAALPGIRESRRILGEYVLTVEDYLARRTFHDEIARNCYYIDIHKARENEQIGWTAAEYEQEAHYKTGESHGIPYRCLVPHGISNLLVAGKTVSCDRLTQASLRVMPNCLTMGEAAGAAAAMAVRDALPVSQINTDTLRSVLKQRGAYFL